MKEVLSVLHRLAVQGREDGKYMFLLVHKHHPSYVLHSKVIGIQNRICFHRYASYH